MVWRQVDMKRHIIILLSVIFTLLLFTGCGYDADESTLYILKNGKVVSTDIDTFDSSEYSEEELKAFVNEAVDAYNEEAGEKRVKVRKFKAEEGMVKLILGYESVEDYAAFNGFTAFCGTIEEAKAAGYTFASNFAEVDGQTAELCGIDDFIDGNYNVLILDADGFNVKLPGTISYASVENIGIIDKTNVKLSEDAKLVDLDAAEAGADSEANETESTESELTDATEVTGAEDSEAAADDESETTEAQDTETADVEQTADTADNEEASDADSAEAAVTDEDGSDSADTDSADAAEDDGAVMDDEFFEDAEEETPEDGIYFPDTVIIKADSYIYIIYK